MIKNGLYLPRAALSNSGKKIEDYFNCSLKDIYSKIFLNHLQKDLTDNWVYKDSSNVFVQHPSNNYSVSILNGGKDFKKDIYAVSLLPMGFWLVRENNTVIELRHSSLCGQLQKLLTTAAAGTGGLSELSPSPSVLAELLGRVRPTGVIVDSVNCLRPLIALGQVRTPSGTESGPPVFVPHHRGFPEVLLAPDCLETVKRSSNMACQIVEWHYLGRPRGRLLPRLPFDYEPLSMFTRGGQTGLGALSLEQAVQREMEQHGVSDRPFPTKSLVSLAAQSGVTMDTAAASGISEEERARRLDLTDKLVLSIDPVDARDLDDALHIAALPGGHQFEVGVHIADVAHYVRSGTPLDREALARANSVYLKHKVIPMLPEVLSEQLCSLNPSGQKLAFSAIFVLDRTGQVISEKFVKTVIRPRVRLNYDQAGAMIDGEDVPELRQSMASDADYSLAVQSVQQLHRLASQLRSNRIKSGALVLTKLEVKFSFDPDSSDTKKQSQSFPDPTGFKLKRSGNSNFLIEEFMLLANQASAKLLFNHLLANPHSKSKLGALLRKHRAPDKSQLFRLANYMRLAGLRSAIGGQYADVATVQEHIASLRESAPDRSLGLNYSLYFCMQMATYCCAEDVLLGLNDPNRDVAVVSVSNDVEFPFHHFGLNVPLYTHFTSPIRRYADLLVHRQIDAIVHAKRGCGTALSQRLEAAHNCNFSRVAARRLDERLTSLYMAALLHKEGWRLGKAIVLHEHHNQVTVLLPFCGIVHRCEMCHFAPWAFGFETKVVSRSEPLEIRLKYSTDTARYRTSSAHGFVQYSFQNNPIGPAADADNDEDDGYHDYSDESGDDVVDHVRRGARLQDEEDRRLGAMESAVHAMRFFREVDCVIYCPRDRLELAVELPFPPALPELLLRHNTSTSASNSTKSD